MERKQRRVWTEDKAKELIEYFNVHTKEETMKKFGFSNLRTCGEMVRKLSKKYNISRNNQRRFWTEDNAKELIEYYNNHTVEETMKKFGFSERTVQPLASKLSKKYNIPKQRKIEWTEEKAKELIEYFNVHTKEETAEKFGISNLRTCGEMVRILSKKYNISRNNQRRYLWTEDNAKELIEYYNNHTVEETAEKFSLSVNSVQPTARRLSKKYNITR